MDKTFFIFLDIDGTLWDNRNKKIPVYHSTELNPASIEAVNYLIKNLKTQYNVIIVVTSLHRKHWQRCQDMLLNYGIDPSVRLHKLPVTHYHREDAIGLYLHKYKKLYCLDQPDDTYHWSDFAFVRTYKRYPNYVVIDDDVCGHLTHIPASHRIVTSYYQSLTKKQVHQYLQQFEWYNKQQQLTQLGNMLQQFIDQNKKKNKEKEV